ncbi:hypothetical protein KVR01_011520 [Diaporthe batatas]|uniref:uncharacterized protein n=1 Tax=Diaporthe batatas TaxID=748121 RepID=UPI001D041C9A|nr:uncharacterized protein KVR01_011520 [Diaporthe batatas]KAG8158398.1 hypothetical protein KVR01_011520 [Diaporthe batatas]
MTGVTWGFSFDDLEDERAQSGQNVENEMSAKSVHERCREVMDCFIKGGREWNEAPDDTKKPTIEQLKGWLTLTRPQERIPTVLHSLAREPGLCDQASKKQILRPVICHILEHKADSTQGPSFREPDSPAPKPVLILAIQYKNLAFIQCIRSCSSKGYPELVHETDKSGSNAAHLAFQHGILHALNDSILPESLVAKDDHGNTPLHYALSYKRLSDVPKKSRQMYTNMVGWILEQTDKLNQENSEFNKQDESPYLYYQRTKDEFVSSVRATIKTTGSLSHIQAAEVARNEEVIKKKQDPKKDDDLATKNAQIQSEKLDSGALAMRRDNGSHTQKESKPTQLEFQKPSTAPRLNLGGARVPQPPSVDHATSQSKFNAMNQTRTQPPAAKAATNPLMAPSPHFSLPDDWFPDEVAKIVKRHYMGARSEMRARQLIYGKTKDTNMSFNAMNYQNDTSQNIVRLLQKLGKAGGFDKILSLVKLPTISHTQPEASNPRPKKRYPMNQKITLTNKLESQAAGRTGLLEVFDELSKLEVTSIVRLEVEDREHPSHTDATIEQSIFGRQAYCNNDKHIRRPISVEQWDWRKLDLSLDVIAFAAPEVKEINLYWSGNSTILEAWSCATRLKELVGLERIVVHACPGGETRERATELIEQFKKQIVMAHHREETATSGENQNRTGTGFDVHVKWVSNHVNAPDDGGDTTTDSETTSQKPNQHIWVQKMDRFRGALMSFHGELEQYQRFKSSPSPVKVGLIDDGVDPTKIADLKVNGREFMTVRGVSFCEGPWYQSSNHHGTTMANMILRINPWSTIYSMRLRSGNDGKGRVIDPESAAEAIRAAVMRGVNIISMSWTIADLASKPTAQSAAQSSVTDVPGGNKSAPETKKAQDIKKLQDAVKFAAEKKVLMFCSASDNIEANSMEMLPFNQAPDHIFRIGAAMKYGQQDATTEDKTRILYYFPGNQVADLWNPRLPKPVDYHDGSSVATALAAGLASLIIYCTEVVKSCHATGTPSHAKFSRYREMLEARAHMERAFNNIRSDQWADNKYIPVWKMFGETTEHLIKGNNVQEKLNVLEHLVTQLCNLFPLPLPGDRTFS